MKRVLASLLSLSIVGLSAEPALAASRSLSIQTGAALGAPLNAASAVSLPAISLAPLSGLPAALDARQLAANAELPGLPQGPAPASVQSGMEALSQRLAADPARAESALNAAFDGAAQTGPSAPVSAPQFVRIVLRDAKLPASEVVALLSAHGLTPRSRAGALVEANRTRLDHASINDVFALERDPRVDASALLWDSEPPARIIVTPRDKTISDAAAQALLGRHGLDLGKRLKHLGVLSANAKPGVDSQASLASLKSDPAVAAAVVERAVGVAGDDAGPSVKPGVPPSAGFGNRSGAANIKVIGIIAGVVVTIALVIALFVHRGNQKDKLWRSSPAADEVVQVEAARRADDADALFKIAVDAQGRASALRERIADAKSRRSDKVGELSLKDAEALAAFDELAAARAALNANAVSKDPARRIGRQLPAAWQGKLGELDAEARATGFDGALGNELDSLKIEVNAENGTRAQLGGRIANFEAQVPSLGGGALKEQREKARADIAGFDREISIEQGEHDVKLAAARARIYARLAAGNAEFRGIAGRRDALARVEAGAAASAETRAVAVETELRRMADQIKLRDDANGEARRLTREAARLDTAAVKLERVKIEHPVLDSLNNHMKDKDGNLMYTITIEDQSGPTKRQASDARRQASDKRAEAERAAQEARAAAVRAASDRDDLARQVELLREDPALVFERLAGKLPTTIPNVVVFDGWRWVKLDLEALEFFLSRLTYDQANELRARFSGVTTPVQETRAAIAAHRDGQSRWLNAKVDAELERQKKSGF